MNLNIRYFGMIAEWTGATEQAISFSGKTVADLKHILEEKHGQLVNSSYQVAVNQKLSPDHQKLHAEDELALLPPFAGG